MRILQLCLKAPYPAVDGGSIAMYNLARGLMQEGHTVHILAMNTCKQYCKLENVPIEFRTTTQYTLIDIDIRVKYFDAFINLFSTESYNISRFDTKEMHSAVESILAKEQYDCVILESLFCAPYISTIRKLHKGKIILRSHNAEHTIWENLAWNERNRLKKQYLNLLARRLKAYERSVLDKVDLIASISDHDIEVFRKLGCSSEMLHLPFGVDFNETAFREYSVPQKEDLAFFHVGSMNWLPHQEAFKWFLEGVWLTFNKIQPDIKLFLAGANMPEWLLKHAYPNVEVTGTYVDGQRYMKGKAIMVVPSFSGSGIRIKIVEGMAQGKVILTTANGALGIPCTHEENIFIAEAAAEWVQILSKLVKDHGMVARISQSARSFSEREFNYVDVAKKLHEAITGP